MAGWQVSLHPEWDMMYAAGLTVREIADRCRQNVATVSLHLRVREKYSPGLRATHEAALAARGPDRPSTLWRQRLTEALAFQDTYHRLPRNDGEEIERSLAQWVAAQRLSYMKGRMSVPKIVLLDDLRDWHVDPYRKELDQKWCHQLAAVKDFVDINGRLPRYRKFESEHERILGVWLHNQHQRRAENTLQPWRLKALNETLPSWHSYA
ncbi:helicase associated domain-containing protein [Glutamicibacter creatinolyticus]|uniref:helicase associated domain-containing protein n=1 Tax=Glutamicibacter creatinolyticus TaxID=162496 RepID=UPI0031DB8D7B